MAQRSITSFMLCRTSPLFAHIYLQNAQRLAFIWIDAAGSAGSFVSSCGTGQLFACA
jgi:hypothetical protein